MSTGCMCVPISCTQDSHVQRYRHWIVSRSCRARIEVVTILFHLRLDCWVISDIDGVRHRSAVVKKAVQFDWRLVSVWGSNFSR